MALEWLTQGSAPQNVNTTTQNVGQIPQWLADYQAGLAGKAIGLANQGYTPYPGQRLADFTPDQQSAFQQIRTNQGNWIPDVGMASGIASGVMPDVNARLGAGAQYGANATDIASAASGNANQLAVQYGNAAYGNALGAGRQANAAVAGPAQTWTNNWQQYMSPYTSAVVNEIGRLGNQNLMENIIPGVQDQFIGSGQFGSTRNADILGRSIRDAQADISGKQAAALESGYGTAAGIFGNDATRQQQQQQMRAQTALGAGQLASGVGINAGQLGANTAISGGQLGANANISAGNLQNQGAQIGANAGLGVAQQLGALGQLRQTLGNNDANALGGIGALQQQLNQKGLDTGYQDFLNQRDWDKNNLTWLSGMIKNNIVPSSSTQTSSAPLQGAGYGPSTLDQINAGVGLAKSSGLWDKLFS